MMIDELIREFEEYDDWSDRLEHLIELGRDLPEFPSSDRCDSALVHGCQSRIWMVASTSDGLLRLRADSDAMLVRGLLWIVLQVYSGRRCEDVPSVDIEGIFRSLGLDRHLSSSRKNGLAGMVRRVRELAVCR